MLETVLSDPEPRFRLRTALRLLVALVAQSDISSVTLGGDDLDPEARERLDELDELD